MSQLFTGISFPFRIGVKGGVVMSSTNTQEVPHIIEGMKQLLLTRPMERVMEYQVKSEISTFVFDPNDASTRALIEYEAQKAIEDVMGDIVDVKSVTASSTDTSIYVLVVFKAKSYTETYSVNIKVGDLNG
jgi:phage baseplate assembly protein W